MEALLLLRSLIAPVVTIAYNLGNGPFITLGSLFPAGVRGDAVLLVNIVSFPPSPPGALKTIPYNSIIDFV